MPSPLAHAMAGVATVWIADAILPARVDRSAPDDAGRVNDRLPFFGGLLAVAPDLDFFFGVHRAYTHSIGAAVLVGLTIALFLKRRTSGPVARIAIICAVAYGTHPLLDYVSADLSRPPGVMALWPLDSIHYISGAQLFLGPSWSRDPAEFVFANSLYLVREQVVLLPLLLLLAMVRYRRHSQSNNSHPARSSALNRSEPASSNP